MGSLESDTTSLSLSRIGEGNGNPLQCSCLEKPRDRGAWWLPSMGSHRVGHDWSDLAVVADRSLLVWNAKGYYFWTVCWRRLLRVPWTARRSNQSILNEKSPEMFIGRTDVEAETPILWLPDAKSWLIWKDLDAGKDWRQEEKGTTEDEKVGSRHWLNGDEWVDSRSWWWTGRPGVLWVHGVTKSQTWPSDWTELIIPLQL